MAKCIDCYMPSIVGASRCIDHIDRKLNWHTKPKTKNSFKGLTRLLKRRAKKMRNHPTKLERIAWDYLKDKIPGLKRQVPMHGYILDFYDPQRKIAFEVDGPHHQTSRQKDYDRIRDNTLLSAGIKTIRSNDGSFNLSII